MSDNKLTGEFNYICVLNTEKQISKFSDIEMI